MKKLLNVVFALSLVAALNVNAQDQAGEQSNGNDVCLTNQGKRSDKEIETGSSSKAAVVESSTGTL